MTEALLKTILYYTVSKLRWLRFPAQENSFAGVTFSEVDGEFMKFSP